MVTKQEIVNKFSSGKKPTGQDFNDLINFLENELYFNDMPYVFAKNIIANPSRCGFYLNEYFTKDNSIGDVIIKGNPKTLYTVDEEINLSGLNNVIFEDMNFTGFTPFRSFNINNGTKTVRFRNCKFFNMKRVINIYDASDVTVNGCIFDYNGYCILGMFKESHKNIRVVNNECFRARADFVEMNCDDAPSENLIVSGNKFHGSDVNVIHETHLNREQRFVGVTGMKNCIISDNVVKGTFASAIHSERMFGSFIVSNNIFEDCVIRRKTESGNRLGGVIEISGNSKDIIIDGNYFIKNPNYIDAQGKKDDSCFIWLNYHQSNRPIVISNNIFDGQGLSSWTFGTSKQSWCTLHKGGIIFSGNKLINCNGFDVSASNRLTINACQFDGPIFNNLRAPINLNISNSSIYVKDDIQYSMYFREHSPTQPLNSKNIIINGVFINKPIMMRYPENVIFTSNMMPDKAKKSGNGVIDGMIQLFPDNLTAQTCNIVHGMNLLAKNDIDNEEWNWLDPIPEETTPFPDEHPLYG